MVFMFASRARADHSCPIEAAPSASGVVYRGQTKSRQAFSDSGIWERPSGTDGAGDDPTADPSLCNRSSSLAFSLANSRANFAATC